MPHFDRRSFFGASAALAGAAAMAASNSVTAADDVQDPGTLGKTSHTRFAVNIKMNGRVDHPGHCLYGSVDAVRICREVGSPMVKINWDLYHMQISEGDLCGRLKDGFDQMGYLQLADHPGRNEPGTGEIHYNRVLRQAYELGYRDYVGLELNPKTTELAAARGVAAADVW